MNQRNLISLWSMLLVALLFSCADDTYTPVAGEKVAANFTVGISTRASDVSWDVNDVIGVVMQDRSNKSILDNVFNYRYYTTTTAGDFQPGGPEDIIYFPQTGAEVTFKSYYPYISGLQRDMMIPVSVADQASLPKIDFMSAEHLAGFSKADPNVNLEFHHRLSKVVFKLNIADEVNNLLPEDITLTINGMKTTGTYDLLNENLIVDDNSVADITIPLRGVKAERTGIVLPRVAGAGIHFELASADGSNFTAEMDKELALEPGYKYIFNVTLKGTEMSVSVTIQDWVEGPTTSYDMLGITTPAGESYGVIAGDQMKVYIQNGNEFEDLRTFTYGKEGKWTTPSPVYWEDLLVDPIHLRAALVPREDARNATQLPDILIATPLSIERNHGADFIFNHAGSRVVVELQSNVFSQEELNTATITLPSYLVGGREEKGEFIPGTTRGNVEVDRSEPTDQFAIIQPQPVSPDAALVTVGIGGKNFTARTTSEGFLYEAGVAYKLIVTVNESDVSVSASVIDWLPSGPHNFEILEVTAPVGSTTGIDVGARMTVYKKDGDVYNGWTTFTYIGNDIWNPDTEVYWKDVSGTSVDLRATVIAASKLNTTQMDDMLVADDVNIPIGSGVDFTLRHVASKATVGLVSDIFTQAELDGARIIMPQYTSGGSLVEGKFNPGQGLADITLVKDESGTTRAESSSRNQIALIQPQVIASGKNLFKVTIGSRDYWAKASTNGFTYEAGVNYAITIHVNEDAVTVSASVIDWSENSFDLNAFRIGTEVPGASSGIMDGEQMMVYTGNETSRTQLSVFTYNSTADNWTASPAVFWENLAGNSTFYASILRAAKLNDTQLDDYLVADPVAPGEGKPVNFILRHPAAKVIAQLKSSDGSFSTTELKNMHITLPNYLMGGEVDNGVFELPATDPTGNIQFEVINNNATAIIRPQMVLAGRTIVNVHDPATGRDYPVTDTQNIQFTAGLATTLVIDMMKTAVSISAQAVDWENGATIPLVPEAISITGTLGETSTFFQNKTIHVYKLGNDFKSLTYSYLPVSSGSLTYSWQGSETLYWDDLNGQPLDITGVYYPVQSSIPALTSGVTTFGWNLPLNQAGGYDDYDLMMSNVSLSSPSYVNFNFNHVLSRVRIKLVSDEFTTAELQGAGVVLNNFNTGGSASLTTATATGTSYRGAINPYMHIDGQEYSALIMPQRLIRGTNVVTLTLKGYPNTPFMGVLEGTLIFAAGKETVITITLKKTKIELSATLEDWTTGDTGGIVIQ